MLHGQVSGQSSCSSAIPIHEDCTGKTKSRLVEAIPYKNSVARRILYHFLTVLTFGTLPLFFYWFPLWYYKIFCVETSQLFLASHLMLRLEDRREKMVACSSLYISAKELRLCCSCLDKPPHEKLPHMKEAKTVFPNLQPDDGTLVQTMKFVDHYSPFIFNIWFQRFEPIQFNTSMLCSDIYQRYGKGILNETCRRERQFIYGRCCVDIEVKPLYAMLLSEVFHPFHVFQIVAISLWLWDEYYQYATAVIVITILSLIVEIREMRRTQQRLQAIVQSSCKVKVMSKEHEGGILEINSTDLVPGDMILVENSMRVPCDLLLLQGSVLVNEDVLTGESLPVMKNSLLHTSQLSHKSFVYQDNGSRMLYGGTQVVTTKKSLQTLSHVSPAYKNQPWGLVLQIGFSTVQGHMLQSILYPPSNDSISFRIETYKFLGLLSFLACLGSLLSAYFSYRKNLKLETIFLRAIDSFSNAVPPSLIASMTVGCSVAVAKLNAFWGISCMEPSRVNVAGQINTIVFDKTGTLTEEGLELEAVCYSRSLHGMTWTTQPVETCYSTTDLPSFLFSSSTKLLSEVPQILVHAMAACHTVVCLNNDLVGEPMELQMLRFTQFRISDQDHELNENESASQPVLPRPGDEMPCVCLLYKNMEANRSTFQSASFFHQGDQNVYPQHYTDILCVIKVFEFASHLQRMSVLVWNKLAKELWVFTKGSPEQMKELCLPQSIPVDFRETLRRYTETGMRVLVFAAKRVDWLKMGHDSGMTEQALVQSIGRQYSREEAEQSLWLLGLTIFNNKLRKETKATIEMLTQANCRCMISTGDNPLTALAVARSASVVHPDTDIALLGDVVKSYHPLRGESKSLIWTLVSYSPTLASTTPRTLPLSNDVPGDLTELPELSPESFPHSKSFTSFSSEDERPCVVSLEDVKLCSLSSHMPSGSFTSSEIQAYLNKKDPRNVVLVLTGVAFLALKEEHTKLNLPFYGKSTLSKSSTKLGFHLLKKRGRKNKDAKGFRSLTIERTNSLDLQCHHALTLSVDDIKSTSSVIQDVELGSKGFCQITNSVNVSKYMLCVGVDTSEDPTSVNSFSSSSASLCRMPWRSLDSLKSHGLKVLQTYHQKAKGFTWRCKGSETEMLEKMTLENTPTKTLALKCSCDYIYLSFFEFCLRYCRVYARMSPDDKAELVTSLRCLYDAPAILMCGDGANDCAALRVADSGFALSDREASLAASFTSRGKDLGNVVDLLREARSALVNSFQSFKYIALYALLQLVTSVILYSYGGNLTDPQYLWVDLAVVFPLSITMAWTYSSTRLAPRLPIRRLVGPPVILSLCGQLAIQSAFTLIALTLLESTSFYVPYTPETSRVHFDSDSLKGYENSVVFLISSFQYIITCLALSMGKPWRRPFYTNTFFTALTIIHLFLASLLVLHPTAIPLLSSWLSLVTLPLHFRWILFLLILANSLITLVYERFVIGLWATQREEQKDYSSHFIDAIFPLNKSHRVFFSHDSNL